MKGCLSLPFRLAMLALLVLGGFAAWSYRDEIRRKIHQWTADSSPPESQGLGVATRAPAVRRKITQGIGRSDSVLLSAAEVASLVAAGAEAQVPGALDSLLVRLDRDAIQVRARVDTRRIPLSFGVLGSVIRDHEPVEAGGGFTFRRLGLAEWEVTRVRVRDIPLPRDVVGRLLGRFSAGEKNVIPVPLPAAVGGLRISPAGLVLYGIGPARKP